MLKRGFLLSVLLLLIIASVYAQEGLTNYNIVEHLSGDEIPSAPTVNPDAVVSDEEPSEVLGDVSEKIDLPASYGGEDETIEDVAPDETFGFSYFMIMSLVVLAFLLFVYWLIKRYRGAS